jgi:2-polyprenyl-6-methoxyphenol hydroxylase-like FAD-dependent oxidoreductase
MERRALIIGGGIGGLTAAIALRRARWRVTVRERDEGLPITGTALGMWPVALRALDAIGIGDMVRPGRATTASRGLSSSGRLPHRGD